MPALSQLPNKDSTNLWDSSGVSPSIYLAVLMPLFGKLPFGQSLPVTCGHLSKHELSVTLITIDK